MFGSSKELNPGEAVTEASTAASARSAAKAKFEAAKEQAPAAMTLGSSREARKRRAAAAAAALSGKSAADSTEPTGGPASSTPAPAESGRMGRAKSLFGSLISTAASEAESEDKNNPFHKKKKPDVAVIDDSYFAGSRPAMALGHGQYTSAADTKETSHQKDVTSAAAKIIKKKRRSAASSVNTMNMNLAPRRNSVISMQHGSPSLEALRLNTNKKHTQAKKQPDTIKEDHDDSSLSSASLKATTDNVVPVRSSKLGISQLCATVCKSWRGLLIILLLLVSAITITIAGVLQGWAGTAPSAVTRKTKEFHAQYEWPRNGQDKEQTYQSMLHDRSVLAHNTVKQQPSKGGSSERAMLDTNEAPHLGYAWEQNGDGPWRVGYRDGLGGISKPPPEYPSQKYVMFQMESQRREQEEQHRRQIEEQEAQKTQEEQFYRRTMQQPMGITDKVAEVDKVALQPLNLP